MLYPEDGVKACVGLDFLLEYNVSIKGPDRELIIENPDIVCSCRSRTACTRCICEDAGGACFGCDCQNCHNPMVCHWLVFRFDESFSLDIMDCEVLHQYSMR